MNPVEYHWARTASSVWSTIRGSLNMWTIRRLVVYFIHIVLIPAPRPASPSTLCSVESCFVCRTLRVVLTLVIMYDGERMSSLWIDRSWYFVYIHAKFVLYIVHELLFLEKCILDMCCFRFIKLINIVLSDFVETCPCLNWLFAKPLCLILVVLVLRYTWCCLWGGASGGGCWATPSPWVATRWRSLNVGWGHELRTHG